MSDECCAEEYSKVYIFYNLPTYEALNLIGFSRYM